jgi:hypothetical protein
MAKMTRQHFQFIANTIAAMPKHAASLRAQRRSCAASFADALVATNPGFKRDRFIAACFPEGLPFEFGGPDTSQ